MKKIFSLILIIAISVTFVGCDLPVAGVKKMKFTSENEMRNYLCGVWDDGTIYYIFEDNTTFTYDDNLTSTFWSDFKSSTSYNFESMTFDSFYDNVFLEDSTISDMMNRQEVRYDYENSIVLSPHWKMSFCSLY